MAYDFDPNKTHHLVGRITFAMWTYRLVIERPVTRVFGRGGIDWVEWLLEEFYDEVGGSVTLSSAEGDLLCDDNEGDGIDHLLHMLVGAELILPGEAP